MNYLYPDADDLYYESLPVTLTGKGKNVDFQELLMAFQEVATRHIERLGFGESYKARHHFFYVVCRMRAMFYRQIQNGEKLTIVTFPNRIGGLQFYRYAYLLDAEGKPVVDLSSLWVMIDQTARKLLPARSFAKDFEEKLPLINTMPSLIERLTALDFQGLDMIGKGDYLVSQEDIDSNRHMNNTAYLKMVQSLGLSKPVRSFDIDFEKESYLGEVIHLSAFENENKKCVIGTKEDGELSFRCQMNY